MKPVPWMKSWTMAKQRCNNPKNPDFKRYGGRGIKFLLTKEECLKLWNRDKGWLLKRPSIDRKESNGNYTFDNCQFIEFVDNSLKGSLLTACPVLQYDLNGNFIEKFQSYAEASRKIGTYKSNILACINGIRQTAGGFKWKKG